MVLWVFYPSLDLWYDKCRWSKNQWNIFYSFSFYIILCITKFFTNHFALFVYSLVNGTCTAQQWTQWLHISCCQLNLLGEIFRITQVSLKNEPVVVHKYRSSFYTYLPFLIKSTWDNLSHYVNNLHVICHMLEMTLQNFFLSNTEVSQEIETLSTALEKYCYSETVNKYYSCLNLFIL